MAFLSVQHLSRTEKENLTVNDISFQQQPLQKIAIAGSTGSGKTTLLKMIAGHIQPTAGSIFFEDKRVIGPLEQLIPGHKGIAYLSQHFELFNNYWVHEILEMANKLPDEDAQNIYTVCRVQHLLKRRTSELSGGEKQRIALARLLSTSPKLLLLDEPFSNLDMVHKSIIKSVIHDIGTQLNITCIMVSHDALDILSWADTIMVMKDGAIIQTGTAEEVYRKPVNEYCAGLLGNYNLIDFTRFTSFSPVAVNGKQAMVRPEQFILTQQPTGNSVQGTVTKIVFWGSYYTADVSVQHQTFTVKLDMPHLTPGDTVYLSITAPIWFL